MYPECVYMLYVYSSYDFTFSFNIISFLFLSCSVRFVSVCVIFPVSCKTIVPYFVVSCCVVSCHVFDVCEYVCLFSCGVLCVRVFTFLLGVSCFVRPINRSIDSFV